MLTGYKDVDLIIFSKLDDITLLNFCRENNNNEYVNKLCFDETFWKNRLDSTFGKKIEKNPNRTWRNLYLKLTYYSDKFLPHKAFIEVIKDENDPLDLVMYFIPQIDKNKLDIYNGIRIAAKKGNMNLINYLKKYTKSYIVAQAGIEGAAESGNIDLVNYFRDDKNDLWNDALAGAARGGHMDLVNVFITQNRMRHNLINWDIGLENAALGGHLDLVQFFIKNGTNTINNALMSAAKGNHMNVIKYLIKLGANLWNLGLQGAALGGHLDLVKFFIDKGAKDFNAGMYKAAEGGHLDLVKFFIGKADNIKWVMKGAIDGGYKDVIEFINSLLLKKK